MRRNKTKSIKDELKKFGMLLLIVVIIGSITITFVYHRLNDAIPRLITNSAQAETVNSDAIPGHITTDDTKVELDALQDLNLRKADRLIRDIRVGGEPIRSVREREIERRRQQRFDESPKQNRPISECIKPNNTIDDEVQDCVRGLIEPHWNN